MYVQEKMLKYREKMMYDLLKIVWKIKVSIKIEM